MVTVSKRPNEFVDFLRNPGFRTNAGMVALDTYMGIHRPECKGPILFDALTATGIKDTDNGKTAFEASCEGMKYSQEEWRIMRKGQGFYECYVRLWNWLWDNQEQLRDSNNVSLKAIYSFYFAPWNDLDLPYRQLGLPVLSLWRLENAIQRMMHGNYFGNECIGFVSNYLRWTGVWEFYMGIANGQWSREFEIPVNKPDEIAVLNVLEWADNSHVAIVDRVNSVNVQNGISKVDIDMCQCSSGGPRYDKGVVLQAGEFTGNARVYTLSGNVPVQGNVYVRKKRSLVFQAS
ncbi:hypothetical protein GCM10007874_29240 [Labrys miyagiensis]|uniref:Uncharacterized protein n=2 Tax=Labrys miyagiensis TaxID=346912 RepID=A0ABQ6CHV3_9HYPH|nr:hypothetical protein GCM10007874_29240 [Labrys miyagiensis]